MDPTPTVAPITATAALNEEIQIAAGSPVPAGWVIVRRIAAGFPGGQSTWIIRNVNGAPYNTEIGIVASTPFPAGWVIVQRIVSGIPAAETTWIIRNTNR